MKRIIVIPAVLIGCLIVVWVGTVAAARMPSEVLLAPTQTAMAEAEMQAEAALESVSAQSSTGCSLSVSFSPAIRQWCEQIDTTAQEVGLPANLIAAGDRAGKRRRPLRLFQQRRSRPDAGSCPAMGFLPSSCA